jgi:WD40 repeat protein
MVREIIKIIMTTSATPECPPTRLNNKVLLPHGEQTWVQILEGHSFWLVAFSPDDKIIASASRESNSATVER